MATTKATKKSTNRAASKTGSKKGSKTGSKGSKARKKDVVAGEPIIVGGGGGLPEDGQLIFIEFPVEFRGVASGLEHVFHGTDMRITRVQITGDLPGYDERSPNGDCRIRIWFD
jgi:hypothetical protein